MDLFQYPNYAGPKAKGTSSEAATRIEKSGKAEILRIRVLAALDIPATSKELAHAMQTDLLSVRPRLSELKARGLIKETGERRHGESEWYKV